MIYRALTQFFVPMLLDPPNLVVSGIFRLAREICTIGLRVKSIVAVVSLPSALTPIAEAEIPLTPKQKAAKTRAAKKAAQAALLVTV
jgi:hypothetical protein